MMTGAHQLQSSDSDVVLIVSFLLCLRAQSKGEHAADSPSPQPSRDNDPGQIAPELEAGGVLAPEVASASDKTSLEAEKTDESATSFPVQYDKFGAEVGAEKPYFPDGGYGW
jgi:hypothetical protein